MIPIAAPEDFDHIPLCPEEDGFKFLNNFTVAADRAIKEAEGYKIGRINRAEGDVKAFLAILEEYRKAEDVTRRRLYLEAMAELLPKMGAITLIDGDEGGVLKLLDLQKTEGR